MNLANKKLDEAEQEQKKMEAAERETYLSSLAQDRDRLAKELENLQESLKKSQRVRQNAPANVEIDMVWCCPLSVFVG